MAKLSALSDAFTASSINSALWNSVTGGAATLDTDNDLVVLAVPTTNGATNTFGTTTTFDATSGALYAQIGVPANGAGGTKVAYKLLVDANNSVAIRVESGVFKTTLQTAGSTVTTTLPTYDPHAHRWWRLKETGGSWSADTSPDGLNWTTQWTSAYTWSPTAMSFVFQTGASVTEVAGSVATIENVNTPNGGKFNPNWPLTEDSWAPYWNANAGTQPLDRYVEVSDRTRSGISISRGRQYELDQVRSGEASLTLANPDAALDPTNASGPWYGHVQPYQPYRKRAQWPATRNLLDQAMATAGDLGGLSGTISVVTSDIFSTTDTSGGTFVASATAWMGGTVIQMSVPSGSTTGSRPCHTPRWSPIPGQTYTMTIRVRNVTASTSLGVQPFIGWYTAGSGGTPTSYSYGTGTTLTGSTTAAWTYLVVTGTAPANAAGMDVGVALTANAAATCSLQVDGWQLEKGTVASSWTCPGVWYPMYAGWTERWTPSWDMDGTYSLVSPNVVDTFSLLSQQQLDDPLTQEINSHAPRFVYRLDDPAGSTAATDWTGNNPPAQLGISKYGAGSWVWGSSITSTDSGGTYTGSSGAVATLNNPNPGQPTTSASTFLKLASAGIKGPADPTVWVRMIAFRYTGPTPTNAAYLWSSMDGQRANGSQSGSFIHVLLSTDGKPYVQIAGPTGGGGSYQAGGATNCVDGDWHLLIFGYNQSTQQVMVSQDGATAAFYGSVPTSYTPTGIVSDCIGAYVDATVGNGVIDNFKGDISFVCEFGSFFGSTPILDLYNAWKSACSGESSNARYSRILRYAGYSGWTSIQTGLTTSMGPAAFDGQDAMSALQAVVDTENGAHFVSRDGTITFKARSARYNATTPLFVFGEKTELGEWPYENCELDYDSTHLSNQITVTQEGTSQNFYATDATSVTNFFPRTMSRSINASDANECSDAAYYLLSRYKQPAQRVGSLRLHPSANPAMWPVCLQLELGMRVRVMRRAQNVPATTVDCFIENIQWDIDDTGEAFVTLQCSPADLTPYAVFSSWHTTLASSIASGVTSITVNASADNTNPLAAQLAAGDLIVLGQNSANQETVTVSAVGATSPGWTTATITLTAATTKAHTAGDTVCEPLPTGVTDPTTYDAVSKFDSVAFAY
ncbi:hypothetical protein [Streptomyces cylindrosporus]|uniref:Uncharacterized protein n=1 Tax=Streptomyces cylindrosporus TaxID=2927583 RepID=A0ABS9YM83_9ACTN|nr:hypothetical protein [Streptomyces cylindrosporus]MCI3277660.1 hypothetical protein [Streptomyces cylindrosporus]